MNSFFVIVAVICMVQDEGKSCRVTYPPVYLESYAECSMHRSYFADRVISELRNDDVAISRMAFKCIEMQGGEL